MVSGAGDDRVGSVPVILGVMHAGLAAERGLSAPRHRPLRAFFVAARQPRPAMSRATIREAPARLRRRAVDVSSAFGCVALFRVAGSRCTDLLESRSCPTCGEPVDAQEAYFFDEAGQREEGAVHLLRRCARGAIPAASSSSSAMPTHALEEVLWGFYAIYGFVACVTCWCWSPSRCASCLWAPRKTSMSASTGAAAVYRGRSRQRRSFFAGALAALVLRGWPRAVVMLLVPAGHRRWPICSLFETGDLSGRQAYLRLHADLPCGSTG